MSIYHKRFKAFLGITTIALGFGFSWSTLKPAITTQAATQFSSKDISGPNGYFKSAKAQFAFHWKYLRTNRGIQTILIFGDFKTPQLQIAVPVLNRLSTNKKTFTTNYKMVNSKGKMLKQKYYFPIKQLSANRYQIKLARYKNGRVPSAKGKTYVFTKTNTSPAKSYAYKYSAKSLKAQYTKQAEQNTEKQYKAAKKKGENATDPSKSPSTQKQIKSNVASATKKSVKEIIKGFNYDVN